MNFHQKLDHIIQKNNSLVCVGLDSDSTKITNNQSQFEFNKTIIDQTHDLVCAYKPNSAFYEAEGATGVAQLKQTCEYLQKTYPEIPIILDAKRADIGSTNEAYAKYTFSYLGVDAVTLQPYLGQEAIQPFLDYQDKGIIILCRTSNPGAGEFQDLRTQDKPLWHIVAQNVSQKWNIHHNCLLVVGATYPEELKQIRGIVGDMTLLIPGVGAQGGDVEATVTAGLNAKKAGMIINSSRGIIFSPNPREETQKLRDEINSYR